MSTKSEVVRARINPELKHIVQDVLEQLGLSHTEAINMFYSQIAMLKGLPFEVKIANKQTKQAIRDVANNKNLNKAKNVEDLFNQLDD